MARNRRRKRPLVPESIRVQIQDLSHDGRGVARLDEKTIFVEGALPGEDVSAELVQKRRTFDVAVATEIHSASPDRVEPRCPHFGVCGGCVLQHLKPERQIEVKQKVLEDNFQRLGKVEAEQMVEPLRGPHWGYRRKARLGVRHVPKKERVLVGFRERRKPFLAVLDECPVLHPSVGERLVELGKLIQGLTLIEQIPQIEVAVDEEQTALVFRNLAPLTEGDAEQLKAFAEQYDFRIYLQSGGPDTITPLWPEHIELHYSLPDYGLRLNFEPSDFTQVNVDINRAMIRQALDWLQVGKDERVLDLFCGLGNFTLPLASICRDVVGVEGSEELVTRARANARLNGLENVEFHVADLSAELKDMPWWQGGFDKVLIDPSREGAEQTLEHVAELGVGRIVYVSCNPSTLARDAGILVNEHGYRLVKAGVMDMFPHTAHVESMALFLKE